MTCLRQPVVRRRQRGAPGPEAFASASAGAAVWLAGVLVSCSAVGPSPAERAATEPPRREPSADQLQAIARHTQAALAALRGGDPKVARREAEAALLMLPRAGRARAILGRAMLAEALRQDDPPPLPQVEAAEGELRLALRMDPQDLEIRVLFAEFLAATGRVTHAADQLDEVLRTQPEHRAALRAAARMRFELGQERAAVPLLERVLQHLPRDAETHRQLALCRYRLAEATAAGDVDPLPADAAAAARTAFLAAAESFRKYADLAPGSVGGYLGEAAAKFAAARLLPAASAPQMRTECAAVLSILAAGARIGVTSPGPHHSAGVVHEHLDQTREAKQAYEQALRRDRDHVPSVLNLAALLQRTGDRLGALDFYRRALKLELSSDERRKVQRLIEAEPAQQPRAGAKVPAPKTGR
ncbi:MAG: hypothetical protein H6837_12045 [Planctomycetes bacterium]|nr:hypothetical protein [Planctomycetota bacterium]